jgi:predicted amidohydrolase YtcJ
MPDPGKVEGTCWADLILSGIPVYGRAEVASTADAIAIKGDRILAVGRVDEVRALHGPQTRAKAFDRGCIIPGLIDGHAHMDREGLKRVFPSLAGAHDKQQLLDRIRQEAHSRQPGEWIVTMPIGDGPSYETPSGIEEGGYPDRHDLDRVAPDNPVYIKAVWGYWRPQPPLISIANTRALELAGINRHTRPPCPEVEIVSDPSSGDPTGLFLERTLMPIVELTLLKCAPNFTLDDRVGALERSMAVYTRFGTTGIFEGHGVSDHVLQSYRTLAGNDKLKVRSLLVSSPSWSTANDEGLIDHLRDLARWIERQKADSGMLALDGIYSEIDEERANWVRAPAAPQTGWAGFHYDCGLPRHLLKEVLVELARMNLRAHCIFADVAELYEEVHRDAPIDHLRWTWGHISVLTERDVCRARDLGLVLVTHTNRHIAKAGRRHMETLGSARQNDIVPLRRLRDAGVPVAFGTDNLPPTMFYPIHHAVARRPLDGGDLIAPDQRLSRSEALHCASWGGAFLMRREDQIGTLEPGMKADLAVLDDDLMSVAEDDIAKLQSVLTLVDGMLVHVAPHAEFDACFGTAGERMDP